MILHLVTDEKFTDYAIKQFSGEDKKSEFVLIPCNFLKGESEVKNINSVRVIKQNSDDFKELLANLGNYSGIVIHGLFWKWCEDVLRAVPDNVKVAWMFWGGEIYSRRDVHGQFVAPMTKLMCWLHGLYKQRKKTDGWQLPIELFRRVDYFFTSIEEEYAFIKEYIQSDHIEHIWFTYYSVEETVGEIMNNRCNGDDLWFCNSSAIANNIFDAFIYLLKYKGKLRNHSIVMPLSYGDKWIRNIMLKIGPMFFFDKFNPIKDYLPLNEYNKIMLNCSTMVIPSYYPCAQGNIITALWLGMRVYLSEKSMAYCFFKRIGAVVFSFESDFNRFGCSRLSDIDLKTNRMVLQHLYSREHVKQAACNVVSKLS